MKSITTNSIQTQLCQALDIVPDEIARITIDVKPSNVLIAVVEHYISDDQMRSVTEVLKKYKLVKEDGEGVGKSSKAEF